MNKEFIKLFSSFELDNEFNQEVFDLYEQSPLFNCNNNRNKIDFYPIAHDDEVGRFIVAILREIGDCHIVSDDSYYYMENKCKNVQLIMRKFFINYFQNAEIYLQGLKNE